VFSITIFAFSPLALQMARGMTSAAFWIKSSFGSHKRLSQNNLWARSDLLQVPWKQGWNKL